MGAGNVMFTVIAIAPRGRGWLEPGGGKQVSDGSAADALGPPPQYHCTGSSHYLVGTGKVFTILMNSFGEVAQDPSNSVSFK